MAQRSVRATSERIELVAFVVFLISFGSLMASFAGEDTTNQKPKMNDSETAILLESELELQTGGQQLTRGLDGVSQSALLIRSENGGEANVESPTPWPKNDLHPDDFISYVIVENINYTATNCDLNQISYTFTAFLTHDKPVTRTLCGGGGNTLNYAEEITDFLSVSMGFPKFDLAELRDLQIYFAN